MTSNSLQPDPFWATLNDRSKGEAFFSLRNLIVYFTSAYIALLPLEDLWEHFFGVRTVLKPYRLVALGLVFILAFFFWLKPKRFKLDLFDIGYLFLLGWGIFTALIWMSIDGRSFASTTAHAQLFIFGFLGHIAIKKAALTSAELMRCIYLYCGVSALAALYIIVFGGDGGDPRLSALYRNPNSLAWDGAVICLLACATLLFRNWSQDLPLKRKSLQLVMLTLPFFGVYLIVASGSRGPLIAAVVGVAALIWTKQKRRLPWGKALYIFAFVATFLILGTVFLIGNMDKEVSQRFGSDKISTASGRRDIWRAALLAASDHGFIGMGMGQYVALNPHYIKQLDHVYDKKMIKKELGTHNDIIDLITSFGLPGLIVFLWMNTILFFTLKKQAAKSNDILTPLIFSLYSALLVIELARNSFVSPQYFTFMALAVLAAKGFKPTQQPTQD